MGVGEWSFLGVFTGFFGVFFKELFTVLGPDPRELRVLDDTLSSDLLVLEDMLSSLCKDVDVIGVS